MDSQKKIFKKTDNHSLEQKCVLRRMLIAKAGLESLRVLDLFAGEGNIWTALRRQARTPDGPAALRVDSYTPVDSAARQPGQIRFKITPRLIEALDKDEGLARYNVIDVDAYGEPWAVWQTILFRIRRPTAVFLTRGRVAYGSGRMQLSNLCKKVMGIPEEWDVPCKIELLDYADRCQLLQPCPTARIKFGYWYNFPRVDYYGLLVEPVKN